MQMSKVLKVTAAALMLVGVSATGALADACSGRDHTTGTVLGAAGGGIIGGLASHGNGLGIIGGALLGGLAGNAISRDMDCDDQRAAARSYDDSFRGPVGVRHEWRGDANDHGYIVTKREYRRGDRICRDFTQVMYRRGREIDRNGTACHRRGSDDWQFM
jgi:surface antigen